MWGTCLGGLFLSQALQREVGGELETSGFEAFRVLRTPSGSDVANWWTVVLSIFKKNSQGNGPVVLRQPAINSPLGKACGNWFLELIKLGATSKNRLWEGRRVHLWKEILITVRGQQKGCISWLSYLSALERPNPANISPQICSVGCPGIGLDLFAESLMK